MNYKFANIEICPVKVSVFQNMTINTTIGIIENTRCNMVQNTGKRIRELRLAQSKSIAALARETGVSKSLISQVERGEVLPSLYTLEKLSISLNVPITEFFGVQSSENIETDIVVRKKNRQIITLPDSPKKYYLLTPSLNEKLEFLIVEFPSSSVGTARNSFSHEGEEYFYVLEGELTLNVFEKSYKLYEGDSGCFDSSNKHLFANQTENIAKLILAATRS